MRLIAVLLVFTSLVATAIAVDYKECKIADVKSQLVTRPGMVLDSGVVINNKRNAYQITLIFDDLAITGECTRCDSKKFSPSELVVNDTIKARIEANKMYIVKPDGKELETTVVRRERLAKP